MNKNILTFILTLFICFTANTQNKKTYRVLKTNTQWKTLLTPLQYYVLREAGTERQNSSPLNKNYKKGVYVCAACKTPLYKSAHKYDSGSGWPAFDRAIKKNIELDVDYKIGYARTELKCNTCGGHLGHAFNDGPVETTGERHCINGAALQFIPKK
ncbi:peptide-methionine (R)-S-oxide reductase MsrB [Tenacibaculum soleae]|uniref:peptide-methionine (R)-S-oxide reductase n=1 Tax=Tenacibaculum soleae TaxID=447689 RepID=A0A1B9XX97_9FLAO|nr:peptide-methionine (R)-S-oxide reductase MsrB [Tenacibaculum soleae]MDO6744136.1 peptide-methionine (R)-S-oxide reductase MsrB [Tenacibaculum soleae]MDO6812535.1 peptide-methionine (R)-S-oxide reductase MsrB [Tenacibaculum soleae]OCK42174.1 peptide-methionine (R)-S-oxide reductase [Tenacibaculum soleae]